MRNLTLTIQFCDISQSFVSATKYENTSRYVILTARMSLKTTYYLSYYSYECHEEVFCYFITLHKATKLHTRNF
jgi:hypothetical protein